jgi:hypothetical protein
MRSLQKPDYFSGQWPRDGVDSSRQSASKADRDSIPWKNEEWRIIRRQLKQKVSDWRAEMKIVNSIRSLNLAFLGSGDAGTQFPSNVGVQVLIVVAGHAKFSFRYRLL